MKRISIIVGCLFVLGALIPVVEGKFKKVQDVYIDEEQMIIRYKHTIYKRIFLIIYIIPLVADMSLFQQDMELSAEIAPNKNNKQSKIRKASERKDEADEVASHTAERYTNDQPEFWYFLIISGCLSLFAGLCSGLTVGYLSIDDLVLDLKMNNGTPEEVRSVTLHINIP